MAITVNQSKDMPAGFARLSRSNAENLRTETLEIGISTVDAGKGGKYLDPSMQGAAVWSSGETWFTPESSLAEPRELVVQLGPTVTWHLKPNHPYWVHLRDGAGHHARDRMIWRALRLPSNPPTPARPSPQREVTPAPEPDAAPMDAHQEDTPVAPATPSTSDVPAVDEERKRGAKNFLKIAAGVMGLYHWIGVGVAIVVLGFFLQFHKGNIHGFMDSAKALVEKIMELVDKVDETDIEGKGDGEGEGKGDKAAPTDTAGEGGDAAGGGAGDNVVKADDEAVVPSGADAGRKVPMTIAQAKGFLKEKPPADRALEEAQHSGTAGDRDAEFLLLKYAARKGSAEAARRMGQMYDPATFAAGGGVISKPDAETAAQWYERAAAAGDIDAMVRLGAMLNEGMLDRPDASEQSVQWLQKAAEAGSEKAKELLQ